jgi:hypothetical protein
LQRTSIKIEESAFIDQTKENLANLESNLTKVFSDQDWLSKLTANNENILDTQKITILLFLIFKNKMSEMIQSTPTQLLIDTQKISEKTARNLVQTFINTPLTKALDEEPKIKDLWGNILRHIQNIKDPVAQLAHIVKSYQDISLAMYNERNFLSLSKITSPEELISSLEKNNEKTLKEHLKDLEELSQLNKIPEQFKKLMGKLNKFNQQFQKIDLIPLKKTQFNTLMETINTHRCHYLKKKI